MLLLFLVLGYQQTGKSQSIQSPIYTIDQAIHEALVNNGAVKSATLQLEYQQKLKTASWEYQNTNLEYVYGQTNSYAKDQNFTISQPLPSVFQNIARSKLAGATVKNAEFGVSLSKAEIVSNVKTVYFQLLYNYSKLKLLIYQDSLSMSLLKAAELKTSKGESPLLEKVSAESRSMEIKMLINQLQSDVIICSEKLELLMNTKSPVQIADTALYKLDFSFSFDSSAISMNPSLAMMKQQLIISQRETPTGKNEVYT